MFGGNFAPKGWALCNGQLMSVSQNAALFAIIGTYYGGNGTTTFALPNLQGAVPKHWGTSVQGVTYAIGEIGGSDNITLNINQLPTHTHFLSCDPNPGTQASPAGNIPAIESTGTSLNYSSATSGLSTMRANTIGTAGGNQPVSIVTPFVCVTFIIALTGIFPTRS